MSPRPDLIVRPLPEGLRLEKGKHNPPNGEFGACLLEATAYVAGEPWSDHPACVDPVLAAFGRAWNDALDDDERQMLAPYVRRLVGTNQGPEVSERRAWMVTDWLARECAPAWLRLAGLADHAQALERLAPLTDDASAWRAQPALEAASSAAESAARSAASSAAESAASSAARSAAESAARSAASSAAESAAWSAARSAASSAAESAAWSAASSAARSAARSARSARSALDPTRRWLQRSALCLLDLMIEARRAGS